MGVSETLAREKLISDYNVSRETIDALERYRLLLLKWAAQINLVGPSTLAHFWERHALDCAQLVSVAGSDIESFADFGSGAGLPGLILAALLNDKTETYSVNLIEVSTKRCSFMREGARALGVTVNIIQQKVETVRPFCVGVVTARAFAPLDRLLHYAHPWMNLGARIMFLKGEDVQREIDKASTNWSFQSRINTSITDSRGCVVEILELKRL